MSQSMIAYSLLAIAIISEELLVQLFSKIRGFSKPLPTIITMICFGIAFIFFHKSVKIIPLGIAYAIWSGCGYCVDHIIGYFILGNKIGFTAIAA